MSLAALFASRGTTAGAVAVAPPVDPTLFSRVDAQRQPLPADVAEGLARVLKVDLGTVQSAAGLVTPLRGPRLRVPVPPSALDGDVFSVPPQVRTAEPPTPDPQIKSVSIWALGSTEPDPDVSGYLVVLDRTSGRTSLRELGTLTSTPTALAFDGELVWVIAAEKIVAYSASTLTQALTRSEGYVAPTRAVFEPNSETLWVADRGSEMLLQVDRTTGAIVNSVELILHETHAPHDVIAHGGLLYVTAVYAADTEDENGRIFEIDPAAGNVLRVSGGVSLREVWGLDVDADSGVLLAVSVENTQKASAVWSVPLSTLVPTELSVAGLGSCRWVRYSPEHAAWYLSGADRTLYRVQGGAVTASRRFAETSDDAAPCIVDGGLVWSLDADAGIVLLNPSTLDTAMAKTSVAFANLVRVAL